jgi:class 3 adenylate cyclase
VIGSDALRLREEVLSLHADRLWIDVEGLQAAVADADAVTAMQLYEGELLPEDRFEPWADEPREMLRMQLVQLLLDWAAPLERLGDTAAAKRAFERIVEADPDPFNEVAHMGLVRVHARSGNRHLALRAYRRLEHRLREELGVEPSAQSRRLYEDILAGRLDLSAPPAAQDDNAGVADDGGQLLSEEYKLVTVLTLDIAPISDARRSTNPERSRRRSDEAAEMLCDVLAAWGGMVERHAAGSVIAVFGLPVIHEDDASRALRAALEVVESSGLPVRIGVNTGEIIGPTGFEAKPSAVSGETMIVANRLRETARPDTILAGERTCRSVPSGFAFSEPVDVAVTPGGPQVRARRVLSTMAGSSVSNPPLESPFVGRHVELDALANLFDDVVATRHPRLVTVTGPAGVGKSRLIREAVRAAVARHPSTQVLVGRCLSTGHGISYWALGEILHQVCGISLDDSAGTAGGKLREGLHRILATTGQAEQELDAIVFALATTAAITLPGNPLDRYEPKAVSDELGWAWPRFASACANQAPTLLVIEDLHWAGEPLLEMVERIAARGEGPYMVLATARSEFAHSHPGFAGGIEGTSTISLRPLGDSDSSALLHRLTAVPQLPEDVQSQLLARAEGNPFFLEQLVLHLADGVAGALPDALYSLLAARIDALPATEKRVLQEAAVLGRAFWSTAITQSLPGIDEAAALVALERRGLILLRPHSSLARQAEYVFKHALLRDVAYATLPPSRRVHAHAEASLWIEAVAGDRLEEFIELIAYHDVESTAAGDAPWPGQSEYSRVRQRAVDHALLAGAAARLRSAVAKAVHVHEQALELCATDDERLRVVEALGDDCESGFRGDDARRYYELALELARSSRQRQPDQARLCTKLAAMMAMSPGIFRVSPDPIEVDRLIEEGLASSADDISRARLLVVKGGSARLWRGSEPFGQGTLPDPTPIQERIDAVRAALRVGETHGLEDLVTSANAALGILYGIGGRYRDALELAERRLHDLSDIQSRQERVEVVRTGAVLTITVKCDFEAGLELAKRCHGLSRDTFPHQEMHATWPVLAALYHLGRWTEMWSFTAEHVAAFGEEPAIGCHFVRDGPVIAASALAHMGRADRASALARVPGDPMDDPETASAWQAWYAVVSGNPSTAYKISASKALEGKSYSPQHAMALIEALVMLESWAALDESLPRARADATGNALLVPLCDRATGLSAGAAGDGVTAARHLRRAVHGFESLGQPFEAARSREALARFEPGDGSLLRVAFDTYKRLGAAPHAEAVRERLASGDR